MSHPNYTPNIHLLESMAQYAYEQVPLAEGQQVIIFHDQGQQQPISYKLGGDVSDAVAVVAQTAPLVTTQHMHHPDPKKDIVAEALREEKIFEDIGGGVKKAAAAAAVAAAAAASPLPMAVKSSSQGDPSAPTVIMPSAATSKSPMMTPKHNSALSTPQSSRGGRAINQKLLPRQQIVPRLQLLDDEDDGLTCRMCLQAFWYKSHLMDHLKSTHSVTEPEKYEREEREKKLRRIREEQQRIIMAKRQRMAAGDSRSGMAPVASGRGRGRGGRGGGAIGRPPTAGPRPSFQYRDGAFICDLCKKSFSDGNDMVTHWKSHVKQQRQGGAVYKDSPPTTPGRRGRPPKYESGVYGRIAAKTHTTSRGRPITKKQAGRGRGRGGRKAQRKDKGKPRWTGYLVWSTRRRKEISVEHPEWSFNDVAKNISTEWKEVPQEDKDKFQEEAETMNAAGQKKMPKLTDSGEEDWSEEEDPTFEEAYISKKPIMLKIKKDVDDGSGDLDDSLAAQRSTRKRKRPSFFQEFENEENNLDKILDEFELEQMEEAQKPKPERKIVQRDPNSIPRRRRRAREPSPEEPQEPVELETSRSGRVRKKPKFRQYFRPVEGEEEDHNEEEDDDDEDEGDRDEYQPDESEPEEPDEEFADEEEEEEEEEEEGEDGEGKKKKITLPPKKRGRPPKKLMTDAEIEEAAEAAAKSAKGADDDDDDDEDDEDYEDGDDSEKSDQERKKSYKVKPTWIRDEEDEDEGDDESGVIKKEPGEGATSDKRKEQDEDGAEENPLEGAGDEQQEDEPAVASTDDHVAGDDAPPADLMDTSEAAPEAEMAEEAVDAADAMGELGDDEHVVTEASAADSEQPSEAADPIAQDSDKAEGDVAVPEEEDLLTSASSKMEEGDETYKDIIAESQIDNIFN